MLFFRDFSLASCIYYTGDETMRKMTNRQRFFINGILLSIVGLAIRSVSLGFNSYISHEIGAEGIGLFTLIGTVYSFAVTFATSGISLTVTRLVSEAVGIEREKRIKSVLLSSVSYSLIFSIFASCVLFFGAQYFATAALSDARAVVPLKILAFSLVPLALSSVFSGYFIGIKKVPLNAIIQVAAQIFRIIITVILILKYAKMGVEEGTRALCLSITLTEISVFSISLLEFAFERKRYVKEKKSKNKSFDAVCKMALPLAISAYIRSALLTLEHILIPKCLRQRGESNSEALSSYGTLHGMALPMLLYPMSPLTSFAGLLVPEFSESIARGEKKRLERIASEALNTTLIYATVTAALIYLFSEEIGYAVYSSYGAGKYIAIMSPVIPIMYMDHVADSMLKGIGEQVYSMWVNISDSLLSVILVCVLIPKMGIMGYAIVIMVMEGYNFLLSVVRLRKRINFKINFKASLFLPAISVFICALVSKKLFVIGDNYANPVWLFLEILFAVCLFIAIYILFTMLLKKKKAE